MLATAPQTQQQSNKSFLTRMTEVIIPQGQNKQNIILPLVASHSHVDKKQWLTWITDQQPSQQELIRFGADTSTLRIIHQAPGTDNRWVIWEALQAGNSHTVIADCDSINENDLAELEKAANLGKTNGILMRSIYSK